jgi:hypothetical protein
MEELIEGTLFVAAERLSVDEAVLTIELEGRLESRAGTGLQRKARITSLAGLGDDVIENRRRDSLSQVRIGSAHGFDFAAPRFEFLQGAEAQKVFTLPQRIEGSQLDPHKTRIRVVD